MHRKSKASLSATLLIIFSIQILLSIKIATSETVGTYHPTGYNLLGATTRISGTLTYLQSDNSVYMTFGSYFSGTDTSDFVDNNAFDVDSSADRGTHANFSAQQYGPDLINDTLTEENTGGNGSETLLLYVNAYDGSRTDWTRVGTNPYLDAIDYNASYIYASTDDFNVGDFNFTDSGRSSEIIDNVVVQLYAKQSLAGQDMEIRVWDGSTWDDLGGPQQAPTSWDWMNYSATTILDSWAKIDGAKLRVTSSIGANGTFEVDSARLNVDYTDVENYELDLEIQWTNVDYDESNELLCIRGGTMDAEDIRVDVWNGSGWENLFTDLNSGWNNVSVSSYLNSLTFTIRFKGSTETGDATQDSWNIDVTLLHVWSNEYTTEVEFTGLSDNETWAQLDLSIDSAWTVGSISVTLQLYNYSLGGYLTNGNGSMNYVSSATTNTDETKYQTITFNSTDFRNATGYWKLKVKGVKITDTPFDFKVDLIKYEATYVRAHAPFGWVTPILFALPVVFGLLFLLTAKRRRKKKTDEFSESFGMTHQQMIGKKMLLEIDPTSDYHKALLKFGSEARKSGELLFIFTSMNSALHSTFREAENVKLFILTSNTSALQQVNKKEILLPAHDLSVLLSASLEILKVQKEKTINMLFDNISSIMIRCGFQKTYNFMHFLLEAISSPKATALFVFNPAAHDPVISSSIRALFHNQLAYAKSGPKVGTL